MENRCPICEHWREVFREPKTGRQLCLECLEDRNGPDIVIKKNVRPISSVGSLPKKKTKKTEKVVKIKSELTPKAVKPKRHRPTKKTIPAVPREPKIRVIKICSVCGANKKKDHIFVYPNTNILLCRHCYRADPNNHRLCSECNKIKPVAKYIGSDKSICPTCVRKSIVKTCSCCGKIRAVDKYVEGQPVCSNCRQTHFASKECSVCGLKKRVARRVNGQPVCMVCCRDLNKKNCVVCGKEKYICAKGMCDACYKAKERLQKAG